MPTANDTIQQSLRAHAETIARLDALIPDIVRLSQLMQESLTRGGKILLLGNGGSAADSQHIAAELVGSFHKERRGLAAIALTTDTSILTSVGNDYGFDHVFSRHVEAFFPPHNHFIG